MPYTVKDAEREVGDSKDWLVGLEASIKKWEQRVRGDVVSYHRDADCGFCFVSDNRGVRCHACPAGAICRNLEQGNKETLQALKKLRKELDPMDCSKLCANFKPKDESPFPEGLKTKDLNMGMVVRKGNVDGSIYTILEQPRDVSVRVLSAWPCHPLRETIIALAGHGCQPYEDGTWNKWNWLREVK